MSNTSNNAIPICLTIAGSDSSGGAGIQADLKTFAAHGCYGMSVITAITAQNTQGVSAIQTVDLEVIAKQVDAVFEDIQPDAVKIGMLGNKGIIETVAERLNYWKPEKVVLDPVMVATSGARLLSDDAISALIAELIPLSTLITPNLEELMVLAQALGVAQCSEPSSEQELADLSINLLAQLKGNSNVALLSKGGHLENEAQACDLLLEQGQSHWFKSPRVETPNTHGTGCTLSSAITANLAKGQTLPNACQQAKSYLQKCLEVGLDLSFDNNV